MTILGLVESLKTMNLSDSTEPDPTGSGPTVTLFDGLFLGKYKR